MDLPILFSPFFFAFVFLQRSWQRVCSCSCSCGGWQKTHNIYLCAERSTSACGQCFFALLFFCVGSSKPDPDHLLLILVVKKMGAWCCPNHLPSVRPSGKSSSRSANAAGKCRRWGMQMGKRLLAIPMGTGNSTYIFSPSLSRSRSSSLSLCFGAILISFALSPLRCLPHTSSWLCSWANLCSICATWNASGSALYVCYR